MFRPTCLVLLVCVVNVFANHQSWPGTSKRPVLSDSEASHYTKDAYLQGWKPETIQHSHADYTVGSGHYSTIQEAVNAAIKAGGTKRKYIRVEKGTYKQIVFVPKTNVPITIYGTPGSPGDVHIILSHSAQTSGANWAKEVNPDGKHFKSGDPAYSMYEKCAGRAQIGTSCSPILWAQADNFELAYVTVENPSIQAQAVAARFDGDKQSTEDVNFYGFQDTLYVSGTRAYFHKGTIKGDVDFIFGKASAVFEQVEIIGRDDRPRTSALIFAPNTDKTEKYGFLLINSKITAGSKVKAKKGLHLGRSWDSGTNVNGQLVIRETNMDDVIDTNGPWATAAGGRAYHGDANKSRNLDDNNYNRFWEYKNSGGGS